MRVCFCKHTRILFLNTNKKHRYIFMIFTRMKNLLCFVFICLTFTVFAQDKRANLHKLDSLALDSLNDIEIRLEGLGKTMITSPDEQSRLTSAYYFVKTFIRALRIENSYYYPFDTIKNIAVF